MFKIVYYGTPEFAVPSLKILLDNGYDVPAVVTVPDKPGGRKGILQSAVKTFAVEQGIRVLQPEKLRDPVFLETLRQINPDLQVVVAFRMLPEAVWNLPPQGTMNLHGSLLPKYRGAAPINWAIINGDTETGATTFLLKHEIDTGDLLFQERMPIRPEDTAGDVHDRMMMMGAELVLRSVRAIEANAVSPQPQADTAVTHAPKIHHDTCRIDFDRPAQQVHNHIRGLSPFPGAWTTLDDKHLKILRTQLVPNRIAEHPAGTFITNGKTEFLVSTSDGYLSILELQLEGKRRMQVRDFLNGYNSV